MEGKNEYCWEAAWNDPTVRLLKHIFYHSVECLKELSQDRFDLLLRPIFLPAVISASHLARKSLQLEGDDLVTNARLVSFCHEYLSYGRSGLQLHERVAVKRTDRCLMQDGPPEACIHCRLGATMECTSINLQHEVVLKGCMTTGFRRCEYYIKNVDQEINEQKGYGNKIMDLPSNPIGIEQRLQLSREVLTWYISFVSEAIADNFGIDELLNRMRYRMYVEGMRYYSRNVNTTEKIDGDRLLKAIGNLTSTLEMKAENIKVEGLDVTIINSCPFSGFPPYLCQMIEFFFMGVCSQHGQGKEFVQLERMTEGRSQCRYVLREVSPEEMTWSDRG